jgi:hypothetical protein
MCITTSVARGNERNSPSGARPIHIKLRHKTMKSMKNMKKNEGKNFMFFMVY